MKAICVTASRQLEVRDVTTPTDPPQGHVLVDMDSCAINHGDKVFLSKAFASAKPLSSGLHVARSAYRRQSPTPSQASLSEPQTTDEI